MRTDPFALPVLQNRRNGLQDGAVGLQKADRGLSIVRFTMSDALVELRGQVVSCRTDAFKGRWAGFALREEYYRVSNG